MTTETKKNVFDEMKWELIRNLANTIDQNGGLRPLEDATKVGTNYAKRYAAALPDDLPVVSKDVSNIMRAYYFLWWKEFLDKAYDNELDKELSDDDDINYRVRSESAEVARALILGVWRVEETGEIVKLEVAEHETKKKD